MASTNAIVVVALCAIVCIGCVDGGCCSAPLPSSCDEAGPICESGYFLVSPQNMGDVESVYCSEEELCGSRGWTRVGVADFRNPEIRCPAGLIDHFDDDGVRCACKRRSYNTTNSVIIPTITTYSQVCGTVQGYQFGSPDSFDPEFTGPKDDVEQTYLDGISITYGPAGSRQHIFSLPAGTSEGHQCPCDAGSGIAVPAFVGTDYICESGNPTIDWKPIVYYSDTLWDGQQCGGDEAPCCSASPYIPYFYKDLGTDTTEDIELRILTDQDLETDEDILLVSYDIYVK